MLRPTKRFKHVAINIHVNYNFYTIFSLPVLGLLPGLAAAQHAIASPRSTRPIQSRSPSTPSSRDAVEPSVRSLAASRWRSGAAMRCPCSFCHGLGASKFQRNRGRGTATRKLSTYGRKGWYRTAQQKHATLSPYH